MLKNLTLKNIPQSRNIKLSSLTDIKKGESAQKTTKMVSRMSRNLQQHKGHIREEPAIQQEPLTGDEGHASL